MDFLFTKDVAQRMGDLERGHHVGVGKMAIAMYRELGLKNPKESDELKLVETIEFEEMNV